MNTWLVTGNTAKREISFYITFILGGVFWFPSAQPGDVLFAGQVRPCSVKFPVFTNILHTGGSFQLKLISHVNLGWLAHTVECYLEFLNLRQRVLMALMACTVLWVLQRSSGAVSKVALCHLQLHIQWRRAVFRGHWCRAEQKTTGRIRKMGCFMSRNKKLV